MDVADINSAITGGNETAWRNIYLQSFQWFCGYAKISLRPGTPDRELKAKEVAQEFFVKLVLMPHKPTFVSVARYRAFLRACASNQCRDLEKKPAERTEALIDFIEDYSQYETPHDVDPEETTSEVTTTQQQQLQSGLEKMPEKDRAMLLKRAEGLSYAEIEKETGEPQASLRVRHQRALAKLKTALSTPDRSNQP